MAKKKDKPVILEPDVVEQLNELGDTLEALSASDTANAIYHATFTPTWRTQIDCGDHATLEEAQQAIIDVGAEFEADVIPAWHRETPDTWLASGHDGEVHTTMTIARIVMVSK